MKLYGLHFSPFVARVLLVAYAKGLQVDMGEMPGGSGASEEFRRLNPFGKVPTLETDGVVLFESEVIAEYLEDRYPEPALLPADALGRARSRLVSRAFDLYIIPTFGKFFGMANGPRDEAQVKAVAEEGEAVLGRVSTLITAEPFAIGRDFTIADAALTPFGFLMDNFLKPGGFFPQGFDNHPKLVRWWAEAQRHPAVAKLLPEMGASFQVFRERQAAARAAAAG